MTICFFCGRDRKLTSSHLFHSGIRAALPGGLATVGQAATSTRAESFVTDVKYPGDPRNARVNALCAECNNNWMNEIEAAASAPVANLLTTGAVPGATTILTVGKWAVVSAALSSRLFSSIELPVRDRRVIRHSPGMPEDFGVFFVWTSTNLKVMQLDVYRISDENGNSFGWLQVLQGASVVILTCSPKLTGLLARRLDEARIELFIGVVGPDQVTTSRHGRKHMQVRRPTHVEVGALALNLVNAAQRTVRGPVSQVDVADFAEPTIYSNEVLDWPTTKPLLSASDFWKRSGARRDSFGRPVD